MGRPNVFGDPDSELAQAESTSISNDEAGKAAKPTKSESEMFRTSLYLSRAVHDVLREIAFHERKKVHELFMEGLDAVLERRRHPSSAEIARNAKT